MHPYPLAQLAAFCEAHPIAPKVLFAPTVQVGVNLTTALAQQGTEWMNLHVTTPVAWAERHVAPSLQADGWRQFTQGADRFLIDALVRDAAREAEFSAAFGRSLTPGLVRATARTVHALRRAGVIPATVAEAELPTAKRRLLAHVLRAYADCLGALKRYDNARLLQRGVVEQPASRADMVFAILEATPLSALAARFVETVACDRLWRIGGKEFPLDPPPASAAARLSGVPLFTDAGGVHAATKLWTAGLTAADREAVSVRVAPGAAMEVRGLLRELIDRGIPLDTVEVAYTTADPYRAHLHASAERLALPVTFAAGRPVRLMPCGQALQAFFRWIAQGFDTEVLAGLCRTGFVDFDGALGDAAPAPHDVAAQLERGGHGRGRQWHRGWLDRLEERLGEEDEEERTHLRQVRTAVDALVGLTPSGRVVRVEAVASAGVRFLEQFVPAPEEDAAAAQTSLIERLREVGATIDTAEGRLGRTARMMQALVEEHTVEASAARPGALHVAPLERAGYTGRSHVYVIGLDEASFPGTPAEDPMLLDQERAQFGEALVPRRATAGDPRWHLARIVGAASGTVTLCARTLSLAGGEVIYPSALFQQVAGQLGYSDEDAARPSIPAFPLLPSAASVVLDDTTQMLAARHTLGYAEAVRAEAPWLAEGDRARTYRTESELTRFDGVVGTSMPEHVFDDGDATVSASRLETLAACPHRYFLKHVLKVEPPDVPEDDSSRWLDPRQFGALLHGLYHTFMKERGNGQPPSSSDSDRLMALLEEQVAAYRERVPVQHEAAYHADRARLERAARVFLAAEARRDGAEPVGFEVSFGRGRRYGPHQAAPVQIRFGDDMMLALQGQIDRIDRLSNGDYAIWDYKTGSMRRYDAQDLSGGGRRLQWALYAYAFEAMLQRTGEKGRVVRSGYFFANDQAYGRRLAESPPSREALAERLRPLLALAKHGAFPHAVRSRRACTYCDYHRLCADEALTVRDLPNASGANEDAVAGLLARWMRDE